MASLSDYLGGNALIPAASQGDVEKLLTSLRTYDTNRKAAAALRTSINDKPAPGLFDTLFGADKGVLTSGGRFFSALLLDALGTNNSNFANRNPLESALASARGDFRVGFGDTPLLKTQDSDNVVTRGAKLVGALAGDLATDPVSYVGAPSSLGRKGVAIAAARAGKDMLEAGVKYGADRESLITKALGQSRVGQMADVESMLKANGKLAAETQGLSPAKLLEHPEIKTQLAADAIGNAFATGLLRGGRKAAIDELEQLFGSRDIAYKVFNDLPQDIKGGIVARNPITGKTWQALTPGTGEALGPLGERLNQSRFIASTLSPSQFTGRFLSGKAGPIWADVRTGIRQAEKVAKDTGKPLDLTQTGTTRVIDYVRFKDAMKEKNRLRKTLTGIHLGLWEKAHTAMQDATPEYKDAMYTAWFEPWNATKVPQTPQAAAGFEMGNQLRVAARGLYDMGKEVGLQMGDRGENWSMLRWTDEEFERQKKLGRVSDADQSYNAGKSRTQWVEFLPNEEEQALMKAADPQRPNVKYLSAREINAKLGRKAFIEDPLAAYGSYVDSLVRSISTQRFVDTLVRSGTLTRDFQDAARYLNGIDTATYQSAVDAVMPKAVQNAQKAVEDARAALDAHMSPETLQAAQDAVRASRGEIQATYDAAKVAEAGAKQIARAAAAEVETLRPTATSILGALKEYARSNVEQDAAEATRVAQNARARAGRSSKALDKANADVEAAQQLAVETGGSPEAQALIVETDAAAQKRVDPFVAAKEDAQNAEDLLAEVRAKRQQLQFSMTADQLDAITKFEQAVVRERDAAVVARDAAQMRAQAKKSLDAIGDEHRLLSVQAVDGVVNAYVTARAALSRLKTTGASEEELAAAKAAVDAAKANMRITLGAAIKHDDAAVDYVKTLLRLAEKLTDTELQAARVFSSESRIREYMQVVADTAATEDVAMQAMGDMFNAYESIRKQVSREDLQTLSGAQRRALKKLKKRKDAIKTKKQASALGREAVDRGLETVGGRFNGLYGTPSVVEAMEEMFRVEQDPTKFEAWLQNVLEPTGLVWRQLVTQLRGPGYTLLNLVGAMNNNYIGGVGVEAHKVSAGVWTTATKAMRQARKTAGTTHFSQLDMVEKHLMTIYARSTWGDTTVASLLQDFLDLGGYEATQSAEALSNVARNGSLVDIKDFSNKAVRKYQFSGPPTSLAGKVGQATTQFVLTNWLSRITNDVNQLPELFVRFAAFLEGYKRFGNPQSAMDFSNSLHFDYADLSKAERAVRVLIPFYTWTRRNVPLQVRAAFLASDKFAKFAYAEENAKDKFGPNSGDQWLASMLPEYAAISGGFPTMFQFGGNNLMVTNRLPYEDLNRVFQVSLMPVRWKELANMMGPLAAPIGIASGVNLSTGQPFDPAGVPAPAYLKPLGALGLLPQDKNGEVLAPEALTSSITEAIPIIGTAERLASGLSAAPLPYVSDALANLAPSSQRDKALSNLLNISGASAALGSSAGTLTPRTIRGELRRRQELAQGVLESAAAKAGVDLQWVRDQLRKGNSPEEVARMIAMGQGKKDKTAPPATRLDRKKAAQFADVIAALNQQ